MTISGPGYTLLGHNEQWLAGDLGHVAVVVELPDDGPALVSPTLACCIPASGMNEYRVAQGIQSLVANDDAVGIPRVLVSRHALVASSPADALRRATLPGRAGGYGHSFAFGSGSAMSIETSATRFAVNRQPGSHTNHYTDPELADRDPYPARAARPAWPGSRTWSRSGPRPPRPPSARSWPTTAATGPRRSASTAPRTRPTRRRRSSSR